MALSASSSARLALAWMRRPRWAAATSSVVRSAEPGQSCNCRDRIRVGDDGRFLSRFSLRHPLPSSHGSASSGWIWHLQVWGGAGGVILVGWRLRWSRATDAPSSRLVLRPFRLGASPGGGALAPSSS